MERTLATLVQVSDVHFGHFENRGPSLDAEVKWGWRLLEVYDGFLGHHEIALIHLEAFFWNLGEDVRLIVTGDLTTVGHRDQFEMADQYFGATLQGKRRRRKLGLQVDRWKTTAIPGNHDHWPGNRRILGGPTPSLDHHFPWRPNRADVQSTQRIQGGWSIRFVRLDTNADVNPTGADRFWARGDFVTAIDRAEADLDALGERDPFEIRVLLLHHSPRVAGYASAITDRSKRRLDEFLCRQSIAVYLCGHTHLPGIRTRSVTDGRQTIDVLEVCCGSTTQKDLLEEAWLRPGEPKRPHFRPNSLIVHRVVEEEGALFWRAVVCDRTVSGFVEGYLARRPGKAAQYGPARGQIAVTPPPVA